MRTPLRYAYSRCWGRLITTTTGPSGASSGSQRYSPGFSAGVGEGDTALAGRLDVGFAGGAAAASAQASRAAKVKVKVQSVRMRRFMPASVASASAAG